MQWREGFDEVRRNGEMQRYDFHYIALPSVPTFEQEESIRNLLMEKAEMPAEAIEFSYTHDGGEVRILDGHFSKFKEKLDALTAGTLAR